IGSNAAACICCRSARTGVESEPYNAITVLYRLYVPNYHTQRRRPPVDQRARDSPTRPARVDRIRDVALAAGHRAHDQERLGARGDGAGQRGVGRIVREVLLAGEEPDERAAAAA